LVEQLTLNQRVPGSSPGAPTNKINGLDIGVAGSPPRNRFWEGHGKDHRVGQGALALGCIAAAVTGTSSFGIPCVVGGAASSAALSLWKNQQ
jgi:hypothetical protein